MSVDTVPFVLAPVLAALATAASAPSLPSVAGVTPRLVPDPDLPGANAARSVFTAIAIVLGPGLGGVLLLVSPGRDLSVAFARIRGAA